LTLSLDVNETQETQRKPSQIRIKNVFGIPKSSDIGRSLENVLRKFRKFGPRILQHRRWQ